MLASTLDEYSRLHFPLFSPFLSFWLSKPDVGAQDPDATFDDDCYYTEGAYYDVEAADDQE